MEASVINVEDILSFEEIEYETTYDITVEENSNFYLATNTKPILVHNSGKSEICDAIMVNISKRHGTVWGVASFECPPEIHVTKLQEKFTNKAFTFRKNPDHRLNKSEFESSILEVDKYFHFMNLDVIDVTIDGLIEKAEEFVLRYGITGFIFDPWNSIETKGEGTDYILQCLLKLRNFLKKYKVHGILVAHPTKLKKENGIYEIATMYTISGSAHFFNATHNGISVHRNFQTGLVDVYIQKVKYYWLGKLGSCSFRFDTDIRKYIPVDGAYEVPMGSVKQVSVENKMFVEELDNDIEAPF